MPEDVLNGVEVRDTIAEDGFAPRVNDVAKGDAEESGDGIVDLGKFDLNLLKTLVVLLDERNVTRASERLFISQQAASGALKRLRKFFGDDLLRQAGRGLERTPLASSLIGPVREVLLAAEAALSTRPTFAPKAASGECRIAVSDYSLMIILPQFLRRLAVDSPGMRCIVEPMTTECLRRLHLGEIDFCIAPHLPHLKADNPLDKLVRSSALFEDDFVCVVDANVIDIAKGISVSAYQSLRHSAVSYGFRPETLIDHASMAANVHVNVAVTACSFSALLLMLAGTPLVATVQRRLAETLAPKLGLEVVECPMHVGKLQQDLIWHERSDADPTQVYLRNTIKSVAEGLTAAG